jgi:H+/Cl- antiporter ClcA
MGKRETFWKVFTTVVILFAIGALLYFYYFSPIPYTLPSFTWSQLLLFIALSIFPGIISRFYGNIRTGQVDFSREGFIETVRDYIHGFYMYWILFFISVAIWNYLVTGKLPWEWSWF